MVVKLTEYEASVFKKLKQIQRGQPKPGQYRLITVRRGMSVNEALELAGCDPDKVSTNRGPQHIESMSRTKRRLTAVTFWVTPA